MTSCPSVFEDEFTLFDVPGLRVSLECRISVAQDSWENSLYFRVNGERTGFFWTPPSLAHSSTIDRDLWLPLETGNFHSMEILHQGISQWDSFAKRAAASSQLILNYFSMKTGRMPEAEDLSFLMAIRFIAPPESGALIADHFEDQAFFHALRVHYDDWRRTRPLAQSAHLAIDEAEIAMETLRIGAFLLPSLLDDLIAAVSETLPEPPWEGENAALAQWIAEVSQLNIRLEALMDEAQCVASQAYFTALDGGPETPQRKALARLRTLSSYFIRDYDALLELLPEEERQLVEAIAEYGYRREQMEPVADFASREFPPLARRGGEEAIRFTVFEESRTVDDTLLRDRNLMPGLRNALDILLRALEEKSFFLPPSIDGRLL